jgi:hypothetical protein
MRKVDGGHAVLCCEADDQRTARVCQRVAPAAHCLSYSGAAANIPAINNMKPTPNKKSSGAIGDIFHIDEAATEARGLTEHWSLADCH